MDAPSKPRNRPRPRVGIRNDVARELAVQFRARLPQNDVISRAAFGAAAAQFGGAASAVKARASEVILEADRRAYVAYLDAQRLAMEAAIRQVLVTRVGVDGGARQAIDVIAGLAPALDEFFLSVAQGRKKRAGGTLETFFEALFGALQYPHEVLSSGSRAHDVVFPSRAFLDSNPLDAIRFMSKRVLRDGWRHVAARLRLGGRVYVGTTDVAITDSDLRNFADHHVVLVMPEQIRSATYPDRNEVICIEAFFGDHLDPAIDRWSRRLSA